MIERCDNCRHWQREDTEDWEAEGVGFGWCRAVRERWVIADEASKGIDRYADDYSDAAEDRWLAARRAALKACRAYVQDGSEYRAELFTAPDFFCALFQPLPDPPKETTDGHD